MKYGLPAATIEKMHAVLARFPCVEKAVLYGSRAKGNFKPGSDIDLTLFGEDLNSSQLGKIAATLDDLLLPYTIDLSLYAELNHAKLREHIDRVGVVFYERGGGGVNSGSTGMKKGWIWKPLGEVCKTGSGGTPLSSRKEYYEGGNIPWLLSGEVAQGNVREAKNFITKAGLENSAAKLFPKDTVLVAMYGATAGQVGILRFEAATNQAVCGILPSDNFVPEFLFYFLLAKKDELVAQATGNAQPNISQVKIKNTEVPVPPLPEQRRIVALLDEAFAGLATAQANAEKNLQNARALFQSHLNDVFSKRGVGWVEKRLAALCDVFEDGDWVESKDQSSEGIRLIQTGNVGEGIFKDRVEKARYVSEATFKRLRCTEIVEGDCLISRLPDPVGRSCILPNTGDRMITAVDCTIVRFKRAQFLPALFNLYSQSSDYISAVAKQCTGTTRNRISRSNLGLIPIPVPPLAEQREIVTKLDALSAETRRLAAIYEKKQAALGALKKSLLHQAFAGGL